MKKSISKIFIPLLMLTALILCAATVVYSYFTGSGSVGLGSMQIREETTEEGASAVTIRSLSELKVWARDDRYRNKAEASPASSRYVLVLGADIGLEGDLFLDRDVSIALNGHTLDLGAHTLTIAHGYAARMVLTAFDRYGEGAASGAAAGRIEGSGTLRYDTPNAVVAFDSVTQAEVYDSETNPTGHIVAALDETLTVAEIARRVRNLVADGDCFVGDLPIPDRVEPYPFRIVWTIPETVSLLKSPDGAAEPVQNVYLFPDGRVETPEMTGVDFYSVSVGLRYEIVKEDGSALSDATVRSGRGAAELTVSILSGGMSESSAEARARAGLRAIVRYFEPYREQDADVYRLELDLGLIGSLRYFGVEFSYSAKDTGAEGAAAYDSPYLTGAERDGSRTLLNSGAADLTLTVGAKVTYRIGAETATKTIADLASFRFVATDGNNANTARRLTESIGALVFTKVGETLFLIPKDDYVRYNLESIAFGLEGDEGNYEIGAAVNPEDGKIYDTVKLIAAPSYEKEIDLALTLTFRSGAPAVWTAKTRLYYVDPSMGGGSEGGDDYAYYHYLATESLFEKTNRGQTYLTFSVPTVWLDAVEVKYSLAGDYGAAGAERIALTEAADGASATFSIDRSLLFTENESVGIRFRYRKKTPGIAYSEGWENVVFYGAKWNGTTLEGTPAEFRFELSGLYRKGAEIAADLFPILYAAYNAADLDDEPILTRDELDNPNVVNLEIGGLPAITSYTGLRYLRYVETLVVRNPGFDPSAFGDLSAMSALQTLELANASLGGAVWDDLSALTRLTTLRVTDSTLAPDADFNALSGLTELRVRNSGLTTLKGVFQLSKLVLLDVSNPSNASGAPQSVSGSVSPSVNQNASPSVNQNASPKAASGANRIATPSMYPCGNPSIYRSMYESVTSSVCPSVLGRENPSAYLSIYRGATTSVSPSMYPSAASYASPSMYSIVSPNAASGANRIVNQNMYPSRYPNVSGSAAPNMSPSAASYANSGATPNAIRRFDGLYALASLREVYCYGNAAADGFGALGMYNASAFVLLADKGVAVYRETEPDGATPKRFAVAEEARECARAIEAIVYRNTAEFGADGGISLLLPETLSVGAGSDGASYALEYVLIPQDGAAAESLGFASGVLTIPQAVAAGAGLSAGTAFELGVRVSKKNGAASGADVWRVLEIAVGGGNAS